jgi:hypothetical protein
MVVAMIPATLIPAFAVPYTSSSNGYDVYVSGTEIILDGQKDVAYESSERIFSAYQYKSGVNFEAYVVVTATGVYFFSSVIDSTVNIANEQEWSLGNGDKFQIYMQVAKEFRDDKGALTETRYQKHYFDCDYAHEVSAQSSLVKSKSTITANGYDIEAFVPWTFWTSIPDGLNANNAKLWIGLQINDYEDGTQKAQVYDNRNTINYWGPSYTPGGSGNCGSGTTAPANFMIPVNLIKNSKNITDLKYHSFVTAQTITLDGKRDEIYTLSEKIVSTSVPNGTFGVDAGFETYIVAREDGFYIFASIYDDTLDKAEAVENGLRAQDGDKFQIYLQLGNNVWNKWGYIDFDYVDGGRHLTTAQTLGYTTDGIQQKAVIWDDQKGWDIEIFIPHSISVDDRFAKDINASWNDLLMKVNFQALNETCTDWGNDGKATARNRYGLAYDIAAAGNAWNGPSANGCCFVPVDFNVNPLAMPGTGALTYSESITVDGEKEASYGDDSLAFVLDKNRSSNFTSENGNEYAKAWVTVTDSKIYLYALVNDTTIHSTEPSDAIVLYTHFPLTNSGTFFGIGYARSGHIETTTRWGATAYNSTNGDGNSNIGEAGAMKNLGDGWYAVEIAMNLPNAEKILLAQGETIEIGIGIQHRDRDTSGEKNGKIQAYNRNGYESYWNDASYSRDSLQRFAVSKNSTAANLATDSKITGANVALGESITVNYYATVPAYAELPVMKFTMNDKVTYVPGVATSATEYKFAFEGIAPQHMGDNIKAELYIAGKNTGVAKTTYSVKQNVTNIKNDGNKALVEALLHYGAAAQQYTNYNTDALVNAGLTAPTYTTITNTDKVVGAANVNGIKMSAAGVNHSNVNRLYVKASLTTNDPAVLGALVANLKVTIDGKEVAYAETDVPGVYVVYTDGIKVTDFDKVFTIEITDGTNTQTLTYSVNAYCAAKQNAENTETAALAKALYAYGVAAENYVA